jgi:hypothetical protein
MYVAAIVAAWILFMAFCAWRLIARRVTIGPAAGAAMTELMDDKRRAALEVVLEERAAERDPEDEDGNLPDLAGGNQSR